MEARLLICEECGRLSGDQARGWAAFLGEDAEGREPRSVEVFCPSCAAEEFDYRPRRTEEGQPEQS
jgi:hypothetical protein